MLTVELSGYMDFKCYKCLNTDKANFPLNRHLLSDLSEQTSF